MTNVGADLFVVCTQYQFTTLYGTHKAMEDANIHDAIHTTHLKYLNQIPRPLQSEFMEIQTPKKFGIDKFIDVHPLAEFGMVIIKFLIIKYYNSLTFFIFR